MGTVSMVDLGGGLDLLLAGDDHPCVVLVSSAADFRDLGRIPAAFLERYWGGPYMVVPMGHPK